MGEIVSSLNHAVAATGQLIAIHLTLIALFKKKHEKEERKNERKKDNADNFDG